MTKRLNINPTSRSLGVLWALIGALIGLAIWMLAWNARLLPSASAFMVAWLAVLAFKRSAVELPGQDKNYFLLLLIVAVVIICGFLGGVVMDNAMVFSQKLGVSRVEVLATTDFWHALITNIKNIDYWGYYYNSMLLTAFFGGLGLSGLAKELMENKSK